MSNLDTTLPYIIVKDNENIRRLQVLLDVKIFTFQ